MHSLQKISTVEHLTKELDWNEDYIQTYGTSLVSLTTDHTHISSLPSSNQPNTAPASTPAPRKTPRKCSQCHQEGHISLCWCLGLWFGCANNRAVNLLGTNPICPKKQRRQYPDENSPVHAAQLGSVRSALTPQRPSASTLSECATLPGLQTMNVIPGPSTPVFTPIH